MSPPLPATTTAEPSRDTRPLWWGYAGIGLLSWLLYAIASTQWQRGDVRLWEGVYEATWTLAAPTLLGPLALPWMNFMQRQARPRWVLVGLHMMAALVFVAAWQALDFGAAWWFFGVAHASATLEQQVLWRTTWGVFIYVALVFGFGGALHARRAQQAALAAARAEAALVRAELASVSARLNPHFLFNTLNSLVLLTRQDSAAAEKALQQFARMMRYVLDSQRSAADRVPLQEELAFVRDYLALESLRMGQRLRVQWQLDPATDDDEIPPLTLQPLVENSIVHGLGPQLAGGTLRIETSRVADSGALAVRVADDGAGCVWPPQPGQRVGVGLGALLRRFALDFDGRARLDVHSAPGRGFEVHILIPQPATLLPRLVMKP
jgi:signal transduction histidine kinase